MWMDFYFNFFPIPFQVDEGRLYKEIIRVEATDRDCSPLFGDVCKYEILASASTDHQPFVIDKEGIIRNTVPLSHKLSQNHILSVAAYDCAMKQSAPVMVNIRVRRVCEARINGIENSNYTVSIHSVNVQLQPKSICDSIFHICRQAPQLASVYSRKSAWNCVT